MVRAASSNHDLANDPLNDGVARTRVVAVEPDSAGAARFEPWVETVPRSMASPHTRGISNGRTTLDAASRSDADATIFQVGDLVSGRYRVSRCIARGVLREVYRVADIWLDEEVALECVRPGARDALLARVRVARRISHPNVCRVFDFGVHDRAGESIPFVSMEFVRGEQLSTWLRRERELGTILGVARELLIGVRAIHAAGIAHGRLASDSVLVTPPSRRVGPRVVITGLGPIHAEPARARAAGRRVSGEGCRLPVPPHGSAPTPQRDLLGVGAILLEMFTSASPFADSVQPQNHALCAAPSPLGALPRQLPHALDRVVQSCLSAHHERPGPDVASVLRALAEASASTD